jgi:dynein heavy chain
VLANEITEKQNLALESRKKIDENRAPYMQVASYVGVLFFTISKLNTINHMYQYSLSWFINLFCNSIDLADKSEELEERLQSIQDHVTLALYQTVSRGLFDRDRPLFSFLLCLNILQQRGEISDQEWNAFIDLEILPDPKGETSESNPLKLFDNGIWGKLQLLANIFPSLKNVVQNIVDDEEEWMALCEGSRGNGLDLNAPFPTSEELSIFQKLLLIKSISPTNLLPVIHSFVELQIGKAYTSFPLPDISKAHGESSCTSPILFVLGETTDPSNAIYELAERLNIVGKRLQFVCLGYGKERHAEDLLREGIQAGNWVILQNCHMVPEWLPR